MDVPAIYERMKTDGPMLFSLLPPRMGMSLREVAQMPGNESPTDELLDGLDRWMDTLT